LYKKTGLGALSKLISDCTSLIELDQMMRKHFQHHNVNSCGIEFTTLGSTVCLWTLSTATTQLQTLMT